MFLVVWIALLWFGRERMLGDPGTLWHTVVGEQMLRSGELIRTDSFTFTQSGRPWIAQQWLGELIMAWAHRLSGLDGLLMGAAIVLAATFAYLGGRVLRTGAGGPVTAVLLMVVAAAGSYHFMPRPHIATIALMAWTYGLLCDVESGRSGARRLLLLPALFAVWANIHGGVLGGIATATFVLGIWLVGPRRFKSRFAPSTILVGATACLSFVAVLANPYGSRLPAVWVRLMGSDVPPRLIVEHAALQLRSPEGVAILVLMATYGAILVRAWPRQRRVTWLVPILWAVLALSRVRHGPLFAVVAAVAIADMLPHLRWFERWRLARPSLGRPRVSVLRGCTQNPGVTCAESSRRTPSSGQDRGDDAPRRWWPAVAIPAVCVGLALVLQSSGVRCPLVGSGWARLAPSYWPVDATEALRADMASGRGGPRVFNDMLFGGYLIYHAPEARVFIDDRCELHDDWGLMHYAGISRRPSVLDGLAPYLDIDYALIRSTSRVDRYLADHPGWALLHRDPTAALYARTATAERPPDSDSLVSRPAT